jgi:DNA-binding response OmpR family regulator
MILVVEDEPRIAGIARDYLERAGWPVRTSASGREAVELARRERPELVVLDLRLPDLDGFDVARAIRRESAVPIIMLTARVDEADRLRGFELGADDYIAKPFSPRELVARVTAVLRRSRRDAAPVAGRVEAADVAIDFDHRTAARAGIRIDLTASEFDLLGTLARHPGRVFTRGQLLDALGGERLDAFDRAIDTHVKNIRRKLEPDPREPRYVLTVYGVGYKFAER